MNIIRFALCVVFIASWAGCTKSEETPAKPTTDTAGQTAPVDLPAPPDVASPPADAERSATGLAWKILTPGQGGDKPRKWDTVEVHYAGWTTDGKMFDSSYRRNRPARFGLKGVIPGWTEGLQLMTAGEKRRFWIPTELAYNNQAGKPMGMLVFDVELLSIQKGEDPIPAPEDVAAAPADAQKTPSGLAYKILQPGTGKVKPNEWDRVEVHYTGWSKDGEMFDSSVKRPKPASFALKGVVKGWTEGLQLMTEGTKARFWIPAELAYGDKPTRPGAPAGQLTFDIELLKVIPQPKPPETPADVAAIPANATKTPSGLAYRVLTKGAGKKKPAKTDQVKVHYTGWTTDGRMFDSSVTRGEPAVFPLDRVIKGWTEGVQLMVAGQKNRFWIPADLAYGDKPQSPGAPAGMLVFDVELLEVLGSQPSPN
jgi:peptidylprolyl isomerase